MRLIILKSAVVVTLALAAPAVMVATANATATKPKKPTHVTFNVNALAPPISGQIPTSLAFTAPGFGFDPRAVAKHCKPEQALLDECPGKSRIGGGTLIVQVASSKGTRDAHLSLNIYLQSNSRVLAVAFIGGPKVVPATLSTSHGVALGFTLKVPPFPGVTLTLQSITLDVGASRVVVTHKRRRVHGKRKYKTIVKRTRYDLLHTPATCPGSWMDSVSLGFPNGTSASLNTALPCQAG